VRREVRERADQLRVDDVRARDERRDPPAGAGARVEERLERPAVADERARERRERAGDAERDENDARAHRLDLRDRRRRRCAPDERDASDVVPRCEEAEMVVRADLVAAPGRHGKARDQEDDAHPSGGVPAPIPASIIERAPSAELRADQRDEDSLPPYELLDRILHGYVELHRSREQLLAEGLPEPEVARASRLVDLAEYKRRQAPPGIKVTPLAFGRDRRMPITNRYRD